MLWHLKIMDRAYHYTIDLDGSFWHEGYAFDDEELLSFFFKNVALNSFGLLQLKCQGETCIFHPQDTFYVVQDVDVSSEEIKLKFLGDYSEILDASTLQVGNENVLYCLVRNKQFKARFNRKSYWQFSKIVQQDLVTQKFYVELKGQKFFIV